jgi:hypothetical protein
MFQVAMETMETALGAKCKGGKALANGASFENRRAAAIGAVSTGSAEDCRSQPSMGQSTAAKKNPRPGGIGRGFLFAFVTLDFTGQ